MQPVLFAQLDATFRELVKYFLQYRSVEKNSTAQKAPHLSYGHEAESVLSDSGLRGNRCPIQDRSCLSSFYNAKNQQRRIRSGIHSAIRVVDVNVCFAEARSRTS